MVRKTKPTPEELQRREAVLILKYGSKEALKEKRREWQLKSRLKYKGTGGLKAVSEEKRKEISRLGVEARRNNRERDNEL